MKSQWHDSWIKTGVLRERTDPNLVPRELDLLNDYLKEVRICHSIYTMDDSVNDEETKAVFCSYRFILVSRSPYFYEHLLRFLLV